MKPKLQLKQTTKIRLSLRTRLLYTTAGVAVAAIVAGVIIFLYGNLGTSKKAFAGLGMHGAKTVSSTNVKVNEFTTLTANASSGTNVLTVAASSLNSNGRFSTTLQSGELLMIAQAQGATIRSTSSGMITVGTQNTTSAVGGPYLKGVNSDGKVQYLFLASELTAAGLAASTLTSISFNVTSLGVGTMSGWTISIGTTSSGSLGTSFKTGLTTACTSLWGGLDPVSGWNAHNFTTPFVWDGTSNIVVQICYNASGTPSTAVAQTNISNRSTYYNGSSACSQASGTQASTRPVVEFGYSVDNKLWGDVTAYNNAGNFEFATVLSVTDATHILISGTLKNSYTSSGHVQVVRVPRFSSLTVNSGGSITTDAWNGSTGGILAIEVNGATTLNGTLDASGLGFRGGTIEVHSSENPRGNYYVSASINSYDGGEKGEGIGGSQTDYDALGGRYGRSPAANGGGSGDSHNSGGGGGANGGSTSGWDGLGNPSTTTASWATAWNLESASFATHTSPGGGRGGYTYSDNVMNPLTVAPGNSTWGGDSRWNVGGLGGHSLTYTSAKIFMGGGGGAGDGDDNKATDGGDGGGIVYLLAGGSVSGSGTINASGANASSSVGVTPKDAAGGGGGGGAIFIYRTKGTLSSTITLSAKGGAGGNQTDAGPYTGEAEGPGGGGGGGYISYTTPGTPITSVVGGVNGTVNAPVMSTFLPNGATYGGSGTVATNPVSPYTSPVLLPITLMKFTGQLNNQNEVDLLWQTASEDNLDYFSIEKSEDGTTFTELTRMNGSGNSTSSHTYVYTDSNPFNGQTFYRLRETDKNGASQSFNTIVVNMTSIDASDVIVHIHPNPFSSFFIAEFRASQRELVQIKLMNTNGALVFSDQVETNEGSNQYRFSTPPDFKPGNYILSITSGTLRRTAKIVCQGN